jgi:hypothetical protein
MTVAILRLDVQHTRLLGHNGMQKPARRIFLTSWKYDLADKKEAGM